MESMPWMGRNRLPSQLTRRVKNGRETELTFALVTEPRWTYWRTDASITLTTASRGAPINAVVGAYFGDLAVQKSAARGVGDRRAGAQYHPDGRTRCQWPS